MRLESDSDTTVRQHTNRGNKLKRKAHGVRSGRLDATGGISYKKVGVWSASSRSDYTDLVVRSALITPATTG